MFTWQLKKSGCQDGSKFDIFHHQFIANLSKNIRRIIVTIKFFNAAYAVSKNLIVFKIVKGSKFTVECASKDIIS